MRTETNPGGTVECVVGRRVVCAANRNPKTLDMILGARHFDQLMREAVGARLGSYTEQGFIDQRGEFMSRTEAWVVAAAAGQIIRRCGGDDADGGTLYSENLY